MPATQETTVTQRREMMLLVEEGQTYAAIAEQVGVSFWTARKWIRQAKRTRAENLASCYGRPRAGPLAGFDPLIQYLALRLKRQHPKWGAEYILKKLREKLSLRCKKLPSAMAILAQLWRPFVSQARPIAVRNQTIRQTTWRMANGCQGVRANPRSWAGKLQSGKR